MNSRLRQNPFTRSLAHEANLDSSDLVLPLFINDQKQTVAIKSMPGVSQFCLNDSVRFVEEQLNRGIKSFMLFGVIENTKKDDLGTRAYDGEGPVIQALKLFRKEFGNIILFADTCFCEYTSHGHCGPLKKTQDVERDQLLTLDLLKTTSIAYAGAGANFISPSGMVDEMVKTIRKSLDENNFYKTGICSYAVKYASSFYGPFRDAADCAPQFGNRKSYQMDPRNLKEALLEARLDEEEGADLLLVKPAGAYLDVVQKVSEHTSLPVGAYQVSGEYSMIKAAAQNGWINEEEAFKESLIAIKRAGAKFILSYWASEAAKLLKEGTFHEG